jgi:Ca2+-transporting ATPase
MIIMLVIAAIISFVVGEHTDAFVILAIIIGNAWMGYYQEYNAERSVRMLKKMSAQFATVLRNDNPAKIESRPVGTRRYYFIRSGRYCSC